MPEHPECLTIADQMYAYFNKRTVESFEFVGFGRHCKNESKTEKWDSLSEKEINKRQNIEKLQEFRKALPLQIKDIYAKGKLIVIEMENNFTIISTLGMTGSWGREKIKHSHILLKLRVDDPDHFPFYLSELYFSDTRRFGTIKILITKQELTKKLNTIGKGFIGRWIITKEEFVNNFKRLADKKKRTIVEDLRDNQKDICAGIGNYLISEILYDSGIDPFVLSVNLSNDEKEKLYESSKKIITASYEKRGVSISDYFDFNGDKGEYGENLKIYNVKGKTERGEKVKAISGPGVKDKKGNGRTIWTIR